MLRASGRLSARSTKPVYADEGETGQIENDEFEEYDAAADSDEEETFLRPAKRLRVTKTGDASRGGTARKQKKSSKGGRASKLQYFKNMPLDLLSDICFYLDSLTLLYMARASKSMRAFLMSRSSARIWISARNAMHLPDLEATDFSEPAYASLVFEKNCQVCGKLREGKFVDYYIRARVCTSCRGDQIKNSQEILPIAKSLDPSTLNVCPITRTSVSGISREYWAFYFAPSVVKINQEIRNLQSAITKAKKTKKGAFMEAATNNLETYLSERSVLREAMLEDGGRITSWSVATAKDLCAQNAETVHHRRQAIVVKLLAMGCDRQDFERERWWGTDRGLNTPKDLTEKTWKTLSVRLAPKIATAKERRLEYELSLRLTNRKHEIQELFYPQVCAREVTDLGQATFPPRYDFSLLQSVREIWESDDLTIGLQQELENKQDIIHEEVNLWRHAAKVEIFKILVEDLEAVGYDFSRSLKDRLQQIPTYSERRYSRTQPDGLFYKDLKYADVTAEEMGPYFELNFVTFDCPHCSQFLQFDELALHLKNEHRDSQSDTRRSWRRHETSCWEIYQDREPQRISAEFMIAELHNTDRKTMSKEEVTSLRTGSQQYSCDDCSRWMKLPSGSYTAAGSYSYLQIVKHTSSFHSKAVGGDSSQKKTPNFNISFAQPDNPSAQSDLEEPTIC